MCVESSECRVPGVSRARQGLWQMRLGRKDGAEQGTESLRSQYPYQDTFESEEALKVINRC
jgi:hypothetical protein